MDRVIFKVLMDKKIKVHVGGWDQNSYRTLVKISKHEWVSEWVR